MQNEKGPTNAVSVPTLADLIQARKAARGWSYREIAARGNDAISAQRWQQLGTGVRLKEFPEPTTLAAMADALEVDVAAVLLATAKSLGLDVRRQQSELAAMLPSTADELTPEQRDAILAVIRAMAPPKENRHEDTSAPSAPPDPEADDEPGPDGAPMTEGLGPQSQYELAANRHIPGPSRGEQLHRDLEAAGEESQDTDHDDPA